MRRFMFAWLHFTSMFPQRGSDYPICEYLGMYSCVLMRLYLRFFGEDKGAAVRSLRTCVSAHTSAAEMRRICFKEKHSLVPFVQTKTHLF